MVGKRSLVLCAVLAGLLMGVAPSSAAAGEDPFTVAVGHYEAIRVALSKDSTEGAGERAGQLAAAIRLLQAGEFTAESLGVAAADVAKVRELAPQVVVTAERLTAVVGLEKTREAFGELSVPLVAWFNLRKDRGSFTEAYCPMVDKSWLQAAAEELGNPYYGSEMLRCGRFVKP